MRPTKDQYFIQMAKLVGIRGTCLRRQVGCVLVNARGHVLATGYNGVARGLRHCNEAEPLDPENAPHCKSVIYPYACKGALRADGKRWPSGHNLDACGAIHAEQNALLQCHDVFAIDTCYVTHSPCVTCVKLLMGTSCRRVVFAERYAHDEAAMKLWSDVGDVMWEHHKQV